MRKWVLLSVSSLVILALAGACANDSGDSPGPGASGTGGVGGSGGKGDASLDGAGGNSGDAQAATCNDAKKNGDETDIDCGGTCPDCAAGKHCAAAGDCKDGVCESSTCQAPSCSDGVQNGDELGIDCGGACPPSYHGFGCVSGTNGSQVCSTFLGDGGTPNVDDAGTEKFNVSISWNATGGNGKVNYVLVYDAASGTTYNSAGVVAGSPVNVCSSGAVTQTFELPLGDDYTYKIWWADCIKSNACSGCGYDQVIAEGGPFGIARDPCPP